MRFEKISVGPWLALLALVSILAACSDGTSSHSGDEDGDRDLPGDLFPPADGDGDSDPFQADGDGSIGNPDGDAADGDATSDADGDIEFALPRVPPHSELDYEILLWREVYRKFLEERGMDPEPYRAWQTGITVELMDSPLLTEQRHTEVGLDGVTRNTERRLLDGLFSFAVKRYDWEEKKSAPFIQNDGEFWESEPPKRVARGWELPGAIVLLPGNRAGLGTLSISNLGVLLHLTELDGEPADMTEDLTADLPPGFVQKYGDSHWATLLSELICNDDMEMTKAEIHRARNNTWKGFQNTRLYSAFEWVQEDTELKAGMAGRETSVMKTNRYATDQFSEESGWIFYFRVLSEKLQVHYLQLMDTFDIRECLDGACCDGCLYHDAWSICDSRTLNRCKSDSCGAPYQRREENRYCSGITSDCDGAWMIGGWEDEVLCGVGQRCHMELVCANDSSCQ